MPLLIRTQHLRSLALRSCAAATRTRQRPFGSHSCYCHVDVTFMAIIWNVEGVELWILPTEPSQVRGKIIPNNCL